MSDTMNEWLTYRWTNIFLLILYNLDIHTCRRYKGEKLLYWHKDCICILLFTLWFCFLLGFFLDTSLFWSIISDRVASLWHVIYQLEIIIWRIFVILKYHCGCELTWLRSILWAYWQSSLLWRCVMHEELVVDVALLLLLQRLEQAERHLTLVYRLQFAVELYVFHNSKFPCVSQKQLGTVLSECSPYTI